MSIVKISRKQNPFVMIEKSIFEDNAISWAAKGVMGYLLSKPDGWKVNVADIVNHSPTAENGQKKRGNGEEAIYSVLKELRQNGYAEKECIREKGIIVGWNWTVFEVKQQNANTQKSPDRAKPDVVKPDQAEPDEAKPDYNNNDITNNEVSNNTILTDSISDLQKNESKPAESKKDFTKQTVEEQLREVWLYANKQSESIEAEKINPDEKRIKLERIETVKLALLSKDFRELIERYREYRKTMKYGWYKSDATLYATVANLAILAGTIMERGEKKINIAHAREIYDFSAMLRNYRSFVKLPEYLQTPKDTRNAQTQAPAHITPPKGGNWAKVADLDNY